MSFYEKKSAWKARENRYREDTNVFTWQKMEMDIVATKAHQQTKAKGNLMQDFVLFFQKKEHKWKNDWKKFVLPWKSQNKEDVYKKINAIVYNV